jgi:hypothetical protein
LAAIVKPAFDYSCGHEVFTRTTPSPATSPDGCGSSPSPNA